MRSSWKKLSEKLKESLNAVLPIVGIVVVLSFTIAPISSSTLLSFLLGAVLLIIGMMFFTQGAEMSMSLMGERVGSSLAQSRSPWRIGAVAFLLGFMITISEPDLQVLAQQVPSVPNTVLILTIAVGVGVFLVIALLRMLFSVSLTRLLVGCYIFLFALTLFVPEDFLAVAFDSGGVTTGPLTVPFIMALGVGVSAIRTDKNAADDSFGLVALCSVGPIIAVMLLAIVYQPDGSAYTAPVLPEISDSVELWELFAEGFPDYMGEIAVSLLPILLFLACIRSSPSTSPGGSWQRWGWGWFTPMSAWCCFSPGPTWALSPQATIWARCWPGWTATG